MATEEDASSLRALWDDKSMESYEGQWIAYRAGSGVVGQSEYLEILLERYSNEIEIGEGPLFAFVTFKALA